MGDYYVGQLFTDAYGFQIELVSIKGNLCGLRYVDGITAFYRTKDELDSHIKGYQTQVGHRIIDQVWKIVGEDDFANSER